MPDETAARRIASLAFAAHVALAAWLVVNGVAHTAGVLAAAGKGALRTTSSPSGLIAVGAGLAGAGALVAWSSIAVWRARRSPGAPLAMAWASLGAVVGVLGIIGVVYGLGFLRGSLVFALADAAALAALVLRTRHGAR